MTLTNTGPYEMQTAFYNELRAMETEDVRDDDTLRLVSIAVSKVATAPRAAAAPSAAGSHAHHDEGQMGLLAGSLLALTLWQERMGEV